MAKGELKSEVERLKMHYSGGNKVILDEVMREYLNNELGSPNPFVSDEEAIVRDEKEIEKLNKFIDKYKEVYLEVEERAKEKIEENRNRIKNFKKAFGKQ